MSIMLGYIRFSLIDLVRGTNTLGLLRELEHLQYESTDSIHARMETERARYFTALRQGSAMFAGLPAFDELPVIDKKFANENRAQLENCAYRGKRIRKKTGGSTGEPFVYYTGQRSQSYLWAAILLSWRVAGYRMGEPVAFLAGTSLVGTGFKHRLYYRLMNANVLSAFDMTPARMDGYAAAIAERGARLLYGYASAVHRLAQHIASMPNNLRFALRGVVCTVEILTEAMRDEIEQAFGVSCYSQYGCNDAGVSAYECEHKKGFHLITSRCYPEILEGGRFVSTDMSNDAFFLPRYDTGDLVEMAKEPCACGRGFPVISRVVGRSNDLVVDIKGRAIHSEFFTHMFREDGRIKAFQVLFNNTELLINLHVKEIDVDWSGYLDLTKQAMFFERIQLVEGVPFVLPRNGKHRFVMRVEERIDFDQENIKPGVAISAVFQVDSRHTSINEAVDMITNPVS